MQDLFTHINEGLSIKFPLSTSSETFFTCYHQICISMIFHANNKCNHHAFINHSIMHIRGLL
ncbi:hypothetical protein F383_02021 [Gossypium arboreum]|uniref:Uncharacterized protein n=1 Tax=Gossypium arboreum TaxID=29729 RepID=A0A0B0NXK8_GOSAR|nr:hypothetical protein F383_02021 [Gossypium arboreum]